MNKEFKKKVEDELKNKDISSKKLISELKILLKKEEDLNLNLNKKNLTNEEKLSVFELKCEQFKQKYEKIYKENENYKLNFFKGWI